MFSRQELTESEKIDKIYVLLKSMQRGKWYGIFFRVLLVLTIYAGYWYLSQPENLGLRERIKSEFSAKLAEFVAPIAQDLMSNMISNMTASGGMMAPKTTTGVMNPEITPEMIQAVQNSMQK